MFKLSFILMSQECRRPNSSEEKIPSPKVQKPNLKTSGNSFSFDFFAPTRGVPT